MKEVINVAINFSSELKKQIAPHVASVHIYPLRQAGIGNFTCSPSWALEYHSKDAGFLEISTMPGKLIKRAAGTIHIYSPNCKYREDTNSADLPLEENYFIFEPGSCNTFEKFVDTETGMGIIKDKTGVVGKLMSNAGGLSAKNGQNSFWKVQGIFLEIIDLMGTVYQNNDGEWILRERAFQLSFVDEVEAFLRRNVSTKIKNRDIARYMKVSESSLNHRFKQEAGISPIARHIEMRIEFAKSLLLKGEKLVTIAEMAGFHDEFHLSKTFKKVCDYSPREYRDSILSEV